MCGALVVLTDNKQRLSADDLRDASPHSPAPASLATAHERNSRIIAPTRRGVGLGLCRYVVAWEIAACSS